jgi:hypothetical protein
LSLVGSRKPSGTKLKLDPFVAASPLNKLNGGTGLGVFTPTCLASFDCALVSPWPDRVVGVPLIFAGVSLGLGLFVAHTNIKEPICIPLDDIPELTVSPLYYYRQNSMKISPV